MCFKCQLIIERSNCKITHETASVWRSNYRGGASQGAWAIIGDCRRRSLFLYLAQLIKVGLYNCRPAHGSLQVIVDLPWVLRGVLWRPDERVQLFPHNWWTFAQTRLCQMPFFYLTHQQAWVASAAANVAGLVSASANPNLFVRGLCLRQVCFFVRRRLRKVQMSIAWLLFAAVMLCHCVLSYDSAVWDISGLSKPWAGQFTSGCFWAVTRAVG